MINGMVHSPPIAVISFIETRLWLLLRHHVVLGQLELAHGLELLLHLLDPLLLLEDPRIDFLQLAFLLRYGFSPLLHFLILPFNVVLHLFDSESPDNEAHSGVLH